MSKYHFSGILLFSSEYRLYIPPLCKHHGNSNQRPRRSITQQHADWAETDRGNRRCRWTYSTFIIGSRMRRLSVMRTLNSYTIKIPSFWRQFNPQKILRLRARRHQPEEVEAAQASGRDIPDFSQHETPGGHSRQRSRSTLTKVYPRWSPFVAVRKCLALPQTFWVRLPLWVVQQPPLAPQGYPEIDVRTSG